MYSHYRKIITSLLLIILIFNLPLAVMASKLYPDIPPGHWSENAADVMGQKNIMKGISTTEFGGKSTIKRVDVANIINGLLGNRSVPIQIILLADVRAGNPDFQVIQKVLSINLMDIQGNKFNGEKKVSRYDFAKFIVNTLNYSQADTISTRNPPNSIAAVSADKKEIVNKVVNYWQLTDGYNDWGQNINRFEALEMVANSAMILDPDIIPSIGKINRTGSTIETPLATPTPVQTPVQTPLFSTPLPTQVQTPTPEITPSIIEPTPVQTPISLRTPVVSTSTPEPLRTPVVSIPSPDSSITATPLPIASATPTPVQTISPIAGNFLPVLRNQVILKGTYNFIYSESLPSIFINETVRNYDDILGLSIATDVSYWFKDVDIFMVKDMGVIVSLSSLGSYLYPIRTQLNPTANPDTEISESFKGNLSILYKLYKGQDIEFATGIDTYYRTTARNSAKTIDSYWRASKNYFGFGAKGLIGWRITDRIVLEGSMGLHYVAQTINEDIIYTNGSKIPSGTIDRFDVDFGLDARMDLLQIGNNWLFANVNLESRILLGDGNQTITGGGLGTGINF